MKKVKWSCDPLFLALGFLALGGCSSNPANPTSPAPVTIVELVTATFTATLTPGGYPGSTWTPTSTFSGTPVNTPTITRTDTPATPATSTSTPVTIVELVTATYTPSLTPGGYPGATWTFTPTITNTSTDSMTPTASLTATPSSPPTSTATQTATSPPTGTFTPTWTPVTILVTPTFTRTPTPTDTNTPTITDTFTATSTPTNCLSAFVTLGSSVYFSDPGGIDYSNGNLWLADGNFNNLQRWVTNGSFPVTTVTYFAGGSFGTTFSSPWAVAIDHSTGNIYVSDGYYGAAGNMQCEVFDPTGKFLTAFGNAQMGGSTQADPTGVGVNAAGTTVYVVGGSTNTVYAYSISGTASNPTYTYQFSFGNTGSAPQTIDYPYNMHVDGLGNVWVASFNDASAKEYDASGNFLNSFTDPSLSGVGDLMVAPNGNLYVANDNLVTYQASIVIFNSSGSVIGQFGSGILGLADGITTDGAGNFYVTDNGYPAIIGFH